MHLLARELQKLPVTAGKGSELPALQSRLPPTEESISILPPQLGLTDSSGHLLPISSEIEEALFGPNSKLLMLKGERRVTSRACVRMSFVCVRTPAGLENQY
jgi:hypothetical protein